MPVFNLVARGSNQASGGGISQLSPGGSLAPPASGAARQTRFAHAPSPANFARVSTPVVESESAVIRAPSERQAMDWSLVLASQGIECALERAPREKVWRLTLSPTDEARAREAIRQFQRENRGFRWEREVPGSELLFHSGALFWALALALIFSAQAALLRPGLLDPVRLWTGEWWRAFTAVALHEDAAHLALNMTLGVLLLGLTMARFGPWLALLISFVSGAGANFIAFAFRPGSEVPGLGASGMVMAAAGMLGVQALPFRYSGKRGTRLVLTGITGCSLLFVLIGTSPDSDVLAHANGFLLGCALGGLAALIPAPKLPLANRLAWPVFLVLSLGTWFLALR